MTGWVCQWKAFWIPVGDSFQKAYLEEWLRVGAVLSVGPSSADQGDVIPETPRVSKLAPSSPWEPAKPQDKACFWERIEAPLPPLRPRPKCDFIHPQQLSPFPERLELPFSCDPILSGSEELASSGSDHFTMWGKIIPHEILAEHLVDIHKVVADFRDSFERNLLRHMACKIKSLKENRDGFYKVFFHVSHFVEPQSVVRNYLLCCPCISATSTPRKKASPRSSSRLFVPL